MMKITYIGTAASEGLPALFCQCEVCENARKNGGREIRGRSGICINGDTLIDMPPDIYYGAMRARVNLPDIRTILVTHAHEDHFDEYELSTRRTPVYCCRKTGEDYKINVYGNRHTGEKLSRYVDENTPGIAFFHAPLYREIDCGNITAVPLAADHDKNQECRMYLMKDRQSKKNFLYGHDTGLFPDETMEYLRANNIYCDIVSLDCTNVLLEGERNHMGLAACVKMKSRLTEQGTADGNTHFIVHHFSHNGFRANGRVYTLREFEAIAEQNGFTVSYDGMQMEV